MSSLPPAPVPPSRSNNTVAAVLIGIAVVLALMVGMGLLVARSLFRNTHISTVDNGNEHHVSIVSPLGNLEVNGKGDNAKVDIESPFGDLHVDPTPDPARLDMAIYPGAVLVTSPADSPFHDHADAIDGLDALDRRHVHFGDDEHTGAQVRLSSAGGELDVNVAEFRTSATPEQVLDYYAQLLGRFGTVERSDRHGARTVDVKINDSNVRAASVRPGPDGTHFVLVRVVGGSAAK